MGIVMSEPLKDTSPSETRNKRSRVTYLSWEAALWILIGLIALLMRLAQLGAAPLAADEASAAMEAWRAAHGQGLPLVDYNPFLLAGNSLVFALFGASDAAARMWPVLFGAVLALTPLLLRRSLGRLEMLASGAYLAISPTLLAASRRLEGTTMAAVGAMAFIGGVVRFIESERRGWLTFAAVGLALGVSSGAATYGLLLPFALALILVNWLLPAADVSHYRCKLYAVGSHAPHFFLVFGLAVAGLSTGLGWNLSGIGAAGDALVGWFGRFRAEYGPPVSPMLLLTVYEGLGLTLAMGALVWGVATERQRVVVLGLWAALDVLLVAVMPGRTPTDVTWVIVPLALLSGIGAAAVIRDRWSSGRALRAVYAALVIVVWCHGYLMVARYAAYGDRTDLALGLMAIVVQGLLGLSFGLILGAGRTLKTTAAGTAIVLLAVTLAAGWGVAYRRPSDPREPLTQQPTAVNVRDLVQTLEDLSWRETGAATTLYFSYEAPADSVLAWYLRNFEQAQRVDHVDGLASGSEGGIAVTMGRDEPSLGSDERPCAGQDFSLRRQWTPRTFGCRFWELGCNSAVEWFLYRGGVPLPEADRWATLWRSDVQSYSN